MKEKLYEFDVLEENQMEMISIIDHRIEQLINLNTTIERKWLFYNYLNPYNLLYFQIKKIFLNYTNYKPLILYIHSIFIINKVYCIYYKLSIITCIF